MPKDHPCMQYLATEAAAMQRETGRTHPITSEAGAAKVMWEKAWDTYADVATPLRREMRTECGELRAALVRVQHGQAEQERLYFERRREHMHCEVEVLRRALAKAEHVEGTAAASDLMSEGFLARRGHFENVD